VDHETSRDGTFKGGFHDPLLGDEPFNKRSFQLDDHKSPLDNKMIEVGTDGLIVELVQGIDAESFKRTLSMAVRATKGVDLSAGLPEFGDDWEEMLKGGLQTALESQVVVFAVSGVSRTCTHQLVRSRRAAFHQQSQRASYMGDWPEFRMPETIFRGTPNLKRQWFEAVYQCHKAYQMAVEEDIAYQDARFILPEGTTTFIMCEYPVREFLAVYAYRACSMFQWEIRDVFRRMGEILSHEYPWLEPYIKISCETTSGPERYGGHKCTFQGWEQVEGFCPFKWAREDNRTFRSERHEIKKEGS
jgi:thymidylate synthase (FAD)